MSQQSFMELFEDHRHDYLRRARAVAVDLARLWGEITIDMVRAKCPPPKEVDPRVMGAVLRTSEWQKTGYKQSERKECHGRPVATFALRRGL